MLTLVKISTLKQIFFYLFVFTLSILWCKTISSEQETDGERNAMSTWFIAGWTSLKLLKQTAGSKIYPYKVHSAAIYRSTVNARCPLPPFCNCFTTWQWSKCLLILSYSRCWNRHGFLSCKEEELQSLLHMIDGACWWGQAREIKEGVG